MDVSTPTSRHVMDDDSALDTTLGDHTASNMTMFPKADDSLLSSVLLRKEPANAPQEGPAPAAPGESESPERIRLQLEQLHQLNHMFESYERALRSSLTQTEAFAQRISETDALLDSYTKIMLQGQRRRQLLNDESWRGATQQAAAEQAQRQEHRQVRSKRTEAESDVREKAKLSSSIPTRTAQGQGLPSRPRTTSRPGSATEAGTASQREKRARNFQSSRGRPRGESSLPVRGGRIPL
ncbi:Uncharacterized protein MSYG_0949 [Malassezia sympodialis ATCC 42132]|uniref:DASH complex subunit DUO1 n=1 Tax=Malassezia sympodialis (strain ATCC 42132) TaxID=1230383 RepID=A0A1M8A2I2_MALS4|nr:Uncharacterized protein MSYG_0949 [Malassezia sympodialis ATCC 42132]